jgi:hypothetical protein
MGAIAGGVAPVTGEARELRDLLVGLWGDAVAREFGSPRDVDRKFARARVRARGPGGGSWRATLRAMCGEAHREGIRSRDPECGAIQSLARWLYAPDRFRGVDVRKSSDSSYLAKMGLEGLAAELSDASLAKRGKRGGHMTPWQIAERAAGGNKGYQALWREYQEGMLYAHQLESSDSLRPLVEEAEAERDRERLEAQETAEALGTEPPTPVTEIILPIWGDIRSSKMRDGRPMRIAILDAVDAGEGAAGVWGTIARYYDERSGGWSALRPSEDIAAEISRRLAAARGPDD